jgi:capsular polysaccharide biosynthesis protein
MEATVLRFVPSLWRYKWLILFITAAGAGVGWSVTRLIEPEYEARVTTRVAIADGQDPTTIRVVEHPTHRDGGMPAGSIGPAAASVLLLIILVSVCVAVADALLLGWLDKRLEDSYRL